jgi:hypothetical protein
MTNKDYSIVRGDTFSLALNFTSGSIAQNISGSTFYLTVKDDISDNATDDSDAIIQETLSVASSGSSAIITIPAATTKNLSYNKYYYDLVWKDSSGNVTTLLLGKWNVVQDVTRRDI